MTLTDHHIYEFKKGVRGLFLHTLRNGEARELVRKLERENIRYSVNSLNSRISNVFFGKTVFIEMVEHFGSRKLNELSVEEDFILGIMLGYAKEQQCQRYLFRKSKEKLAGKNLSFSVAL